MNETRTIVRLACACCIAAFLTIGDAGAQAFPGKPLRIIVPFAAGEPADITSRIIAPRMTELLGQPIVIENRGGANGVIGAEAVIKSPADGYTLLLCTASIAAINVVTYGDKPPYDTRRDLQALTPLMSTTSLVVVHPSMPVKTLKELVALAKARPAQITFGSAGTGGTLHFGLELLLREANVHITHVPYKGAGPASAEVVAGQINGMFVDLPVISEYVKAGKVRALADQRRALQVLPGRAHDERGRVSGGGDDQLLWPAAAGQDAARDRREAARRGGEDGRDAGRARTAGRCRGGSADDVAGRVHAIHSQRHREMGQAREIGGYRDRALGNNRRIDPRVALDGNDTPSRRVRGEGRE